MAKAHTLKPFLLAALAFALAGLGQSALSGPLISTSWIVYAIAAVLFVAAAVLFVAAFRRVAGSQFALGHLSDVPDTATGLLTSRLLWVLLIIAALATLGSVVFFSTSAGAPNAWNLHIVSVLLFIAAFIPFDKLRRRSLPPRTQFAAELVHVLPIVAVLALAAFARVWELGEFPFGDWYDEASNGLAAAQILKDASFRPVFIDATLMPSHFNYLIAFSFSLFGVNPTALRLVTATFGFAAVLFAYLLFRRWFGGGLGVVAACVLAVMRYHLTFSRFGLQGIATPAFELATLYFLDRALAEKKVSDFAWFGLMVGFGLAFYFAFRLFPIVLAVFLVGLLIAALVRYDVRETNRRFVKGMWQHWLIAAVAVLIALAPVAQFAIRNNDAFFKRTGTTSIFQGHDEPDLAKALWNNLSKHLLMFNVQGDRNGRHNLPGAPMLDPVMGALFILGIANALWRWRDPPNSLMLLVFIIMIQGGVLSLDFEAPQSLRAIGVIPALVYFITLPLAGIAEAIKDARRRESPNSQTPNSRFGHWNLGVGVCGLAVLVLLALVTYFNLAMFFDTQKNDPSAWAAYSTGETIVANEMNRLAASDDFVLSAAYDKPPTVAFLAGNVTNYQRWTVIDRFPLVRDAERGVVLMFDETLLSAYNDARRFYPSAKYQEHHAPKGGGPVMYEIYLTPDDLRAVRGVVARYFKGNTVEDKPAKEETLAQLAVDWTQTQPLNDPFVAEFRSTLYAQQYGSYRFGVRGAPVSTLWIDENPVSDPPLTLARGNHALRLQVRGNANKVELWWQPPNAPPQLVPVANLFRAPVTNSGLLGAYYPSPNWTGIPAFVQIDPEIAFYFHIIPLPRPYTVEWIGKLFAPTAGEYRFALKSVDDSRLMLNDRVVVENPKGHATVEGVTQLEKGWHDISVHYSDKTGATQIYLYWTPPGSTESELVPSHYLSPPMGQYPIPNDGDR